MTTNIQIQNRLKNNKHFVGVFSADSLPDVTTLNVDSSLIVNYSKSNHPGSHWVAFLQ